MSDAHGHDDHHGAPSVPRISRAALIRYGTPVLLIGIVFLIYWSPTSAAFIYEAIAFLSPVWLPLLLLRIAWPLWLHFARAYYVSGIPYSTIELHPGSETPRTARPMELIFYSLYHRIEITKRDFLLGRVRPWWSFEVYVHAGAARFFVHLPTSHLAAVESRIRAEYHDIEIDTVRDYSREVAFHPSSMRAFSREFSLAKPDPYPIQTYEHYESLTDRRDPFSEMLEELAVIGKDEHFFISLIVRPHQRERTSYFEEPHDTLHEDAYRVIQELVGTRGELHALPASKQALVSAIEAALRKPSFDCGIRVLYLAEKTSYQAAREEKIAHLYERFDDSELNELHAYDPATGVGVARSELFSLSPYLQSDFFVDLFRRRAFFAPPYVGKSFVLNTEELATLFHMPQAGRGGVVSARSAARLEAPDNLPV